MAPYHAVIKDHLGAPYKLQQVQNCRNQIRNCLNFLRSAKEVSTLDDLASNRRFLDDLFHCIREPIDSLTLPPRKSVLEHMTNPSRKCFHPPMPNDIVLSFFLRGPVLSLASYALAYNGPERRWEIVGRMCVECVVPRLRQVLQLLYAASDSTAFLVNRLGTVT